MSERRPRRVNFILAAEFIPICPVHECDMRPYSRRPNLVYFECPIENCEERGISARKIFRAVRAALGTKAPSSA